MNNHIISQNASLIDALRKINALPGGKMALFAVDTDNRITGSLTDGDIRRALLNGASTDQPVSTAMNRNFNAVSPTDIDIPATLRAIRKLGITLVPFVSENGTIEKILDLNTTHTILPLSAILMAGGKGERLRPLTLHTPKPLLEIDGKAIIDYNVEALTRAGITDITVTTRYLAEQLHDHFSKPIAGVQVKCVTEDIPLGTIGSATLVDLPANGDTLIMNSDLITTISLEDMYACHHDNDADITIATIPYQISVPYAILEIKDDRVVNIAEKPSYSYYANAGIYIIKNSLLHTLPKNQKTDATDLIQTAIAQGRTIVHHTINGTWIDVGSPTEFRQAAEMIRHHRNLSTI